MLVLAIDPGPIESGVVVLLDGYHPWWHGIVKNNEVEKVIDSLLGDDRPEVVIEMVSSYGLPVGKDMYETAVWIGRFTEIFARKGWRLKRIYRPDVKLNICRSRSASDQNVINALINRFDPYRSNHGKGTKRDPGFFYGFKHDVWQAYALGVTYIDMKRSGTV